MQLSKDTASRITMTGLAVALASLAPGLAACDAGDARPPSLQIDRVTETSVTGRYHAGDVRLGFAISAHPDTGVSLVIAEDGNPTPVLELVDTDGEHIAVRVAGIDLDAAQEDAAAVDDILAAMDRPAWLAAVGLAAELDALADEGAAPPALADLADAAIAAAEAVSEAAPQGYCCQRLVWTYNCHWDPNRPNGCYYWGWLCGANYCGGPY